MAARQFYQPISLNGLELQNFVFQNLATRPANPTPGMAIFNTATALFEVYDGTIWAPTNPAKAIGGSIPNTALTTNPLARANHTGTQIAATISDLASTVKAYTLDSFAAPVAAVNFNGQTAINLPAPTANGQAATYEWVIGQVQQSAAGIASKTPVRVVAVSSITLSGTQTIDGVALAVGDRVLVTAQSDPKTNGVYVVSSGAWTRAGPTGDNVDEIEPGAFWMVTEGSTYAASQWRVSTTGTITVGTTPITIAQFGQMSVYANGNGLNLVGNTFSVKSSTGILVTAAGVAVDPSVVVGKFSQTFGDGTATSFTFNHGLNTADVIVFVKSNTNPAARVEPEILILSATQVQVNFTGITPAANSFRVTILG